MSVIIEPIRYYVSFDCGNISLGYCIFSVPITVTVTVDGFIDPVTAPITRISEGVIDVLEGVKLSSTTPVYRAQQLHKHLALIDVSMCAPADTHILIEYQMGPNVKSHSVFDGIVMYYTAVGFTNIITVGPSLKNRIHFAADSAHNVFLPRYSRSYAANKAHTAHNFNVFAMAKNWVINIPRALYKDVGDAFMQAMAWHFAKGGANLIPSADGASHVGLKTSITPHAEVAPRARKPRRDTTTAAITNILSGKNKA